LLSLLCVSAVLFVLFRVISWIVAFELEKEPIHESTRNNTKRTAETQRTLRKRGEFLKEIQRSEKKNSSD